MKMLQQQEERKERMERERIREERERVRDERREANDRMFQTMIMACIGGVAQKHQKK